MPDSLYRRVDYTNEADLEQAIRDVAGDLFGHGRLYLNVKKKVGKNVPDGYLIDLRGPEANLYFVEVERSAHDPFRHIAVQILQFSFAFSENPWTVKSVLFEALKSDALAWSACEQFVIDRQLHSVDHLLEGLIRRPFSAIVIIDSSSDLLDVLLTERLKFPVEVLQLQRFETSAGQRSYQFEPFLADIALDLDVGATGAPTSVTLDLAEIDTIVVPAQKEGFEEAFLGANEWSSVRIRGSRIPQIKYIAAYQVYPKSAITHIAPVKDIIPSKDQPLKKQLIFSEPAQEIGPITLVPGGRIKPLQNIRYTSKDRLENAKTLDDVWGLPEPEDRSSNEPGPAD
jgi:hypothetical protein